MNSGSRSSWICCQLGAREHYAIPRALHQAGALRRLYTDLWAPPGSLAATLAGRRARDRFHPDLAAAPVSASNSRAFAFELRLRRRASGWDAILQRNDWFQSRVLASLGPLLSPGSVVFSYSYTARHIFQAARQAGCRTVLGQIDPGPEEERLVAAVHRDSPALAGPWLPAPPLYWQHWAEECALADTIVVNSQWSADALRAEGIPAAKIRIVPLVYQSPAAAAGFVRHYPPAFTPARPLRVLFLGQVNLRKGLGPILDALPSLAGLPLRIQFVGPVQIDLPEELRRHPQLEWVGPVPRGLVADYYRQADLFLFPTLSDGFGLTQLEAQAWRLPIVASARCGQVVVPGRTGWVLHPVTPAAIAELLAGCVARPAELARLSAAIAPPDAGLSALAASLFSCAS
jgi:glycosyltransferase involved in cell wall biosynthesis